MSEGVEHDRSKLSALDELQALVAVGRERRVAAENADGEERAGFGREHASPTRLRTRPIRHEPETLTIKVPQGKSGPNWFPTNSPTK